MGESSSRTDKISSGVSAVFVGMVIFNVIGIVFQPLLVRMLGTAQYGELATVLAVFGITSNIALLGMDNSIKKYIAEYNDSRDEIFSFSLIFLIFTGLLVLIVGYASFSISFVRNFVGSELVFLITIALIGVLTTNVYQNFRGVLYGLYSEDYAEITKVVRKLLYPVLAVILLIEGLGVKGVIIAYVISPLVAGVLGYYFLRNRVNFSVSNFWKGFDNFGKDITSYGSFILVSILMTQIHYEADILLIRFFSGETSTGIYKGALVLAQFLWIVPKAIQQTMVHNTSDLFSNGETKQIEQIFTDLIKFVSPILILLGTGVIVLSRPFLTVYYGKEFAVGTLALQILILGVSLMGIARLLTPILDGTNYFRESAFISITATGINLILNLLLIPRFGINGAAVATSFSYGSLVFMYAFVVRKKLEISVFSNLEFKKLFFSFVILLSTLLGLSSFLSGEIIKLILIPPSGFLVYSFVVFKLNILGVDEVFDLVEDTPLNEFESIKKVLERLRILIKRIV